MLSREEFYGRGEDWDALCASFDDFTPTQSYAWGCAREGEGWRATRLVWRDASGTVAAAATILVRRRLGFRFHYVSRGPLVRRTGASRGEVEASFRECIDALKRDLGWGEVLVCALHSSLADIGPETIAATGLRPLFPTDSPHGISSIIDLDGPDVLPRRASSDWRNRYRKSQALLEDVRSSSEPETILAARRLVASLETRKGFTTTITAALLRGLARAGARVFYLEGPDGRMTAALLLAVAGPRVFRLMAGVLPEALRRSPGAGRVLEVAALRWAFETGFSSYDLEGLDPASRGVWDFKSGMKGTLFAGAGLHALSRPAVIGRAFSYYSRRAWRTPRLLCRAAPAYFVRTLVRTLSGGRLDARRMRLYERDLSGMPPAGTRPGFAPLVLEDFDAEAFRYRLSTVRELWPRLASLARGSLECLVLSGPDGYAVGYGFLAWRNATLPEIGVDWPLRPGEAYIHDCVILPEFRGQKLYGYLLDQLCAHARRRGAARALIAVDAGNVPSVRGIEGAGFVQEREAVFHRAWIWRRLRWVPTAI